MNIRDIITTKPRSCVSFKSIATYTEIQEAISTGCTNRYLHGIISTCRANPTNTAFVVYKAEQQAILVVFGNPVLSIILESSVVQTELEATSKPGYLYIWCHSLSS